MKNFINTILTEISIRNKKGYPDFSDREDIAILSTILTEMGYGYIKDEVIKSLVLKEEDERRDYENPILNTLIKYRNDKDEEVENSVGNLLHTKKGTPGRDAAEKYLKGKGIDIEAVDNLKQDMSDYQGPDDPSKTRGTDVDIDEPDPRRLTPDDYSHAPDLMDDKEGSPDFKFNTNLDEMIVKMEFDRKMGIAGAGGKAASHGEERFCYVANKIDYDKFVKSEKDAIKIEIENIRGRTGRRKFPNRAERDILKSMGLLEKFKEGGKGEEEALEYFGAREVFANQQLKEIKSIPDSIFYTIGRDAFDADDSQYKSWMYSSFDSGISMARTIRKMEKFNKRRKVRIFQNSPDTSQMILSELNSRIDKAKDESDLEALAHYTRELKVYEKYTHADTTAIGYDKKGRLTLLCISNKKASDFSDIIHNGSPATRVAIIKENFDENVTQTVKEELDEITKLSTKVRDETIRKSPFIELTDDLEKLVSTREVAKYLDRLEDRKDFLEFIEEKGLTFKTLSYGNKYRMMMDHAKLILDSGKTPPMSPYGEVPIKLGEYAGNPRFKRENSTINFDDPSIKAYVKIKEREKSVMTEIHRGIVDRLKEEDRLASQKYGKEVRKHTQAYILSALQDAKFFEWIESDNSEFVLQSGARTIKPTDFRNGLASALRYKGDPHSPEGRRELKKLLIEACVLDEKTGKIFIQTEHPPQIISEETWRMAGKATKVQIIIGKDLRKAILQSVDKEPVSDAS